MDSPRAASPSETTVDPLRRGLKESRNRAKEPRPPPFRAWGLSRGYRPAGALPALTPSTHTPAARAGGRRRARLARPGRSRPRRSYLTLELNDEMDREKKKDEKNEKEDEKHQ